MKVIILAGGSGVRLWPLSRERYPKQFIKLQNKKESLFQETFSRSLLLAGADDIYVVTNKHYKFLVMGEVEELGHAYNEENIIVEPEAKNTLPAIYAGIMKAVRNGHDAVTVFPSDHMISEGMAFAGLIKQSETFTKDYLITFGIKPSGPNTGYGYISSGSKIGNGFLVNAFKEKPTKEKAVEYISSGYLWNSGIFLFHSSLFIDEVKEYSPEVYQAFQSGEDLNEVFPKISRGISIDYGIMEKSRKVAVVPADIGWNDLGSFDSFYDVFDKDEYGNIINNDSITIDSTNNLIHSEDGKLIAVIGIEDSIIIDNRDALLICKKEQSQKVKDIVEELHVRNDARSEHHVRDYRPWGQHKVLEEEKDSFKIRRITINCGKGISYQLHYHRSEHWIVVKGTAKVTIDGDTSLVHTGESIYVKAGQKHRLENPGSIVLEIIEVQMGDYLEEDDIVRFDNNDGT